LESIDFNFSNNSLDLMNFPRRKWQEPPAEEPFPERIYPVRRRPPTEWQEPVSEQRVMVLKHPNKPMEARPKMIANSKSHYIQPKLLGPSISAQEACNFPRFKRMKTQTPVQAHEKALALKKKNAETWIMILAPLLYQKTADSRYQDEHVSNILSSYNQISTARHLQVWQQFTEWCEPFGFHPAKLHIKLDNIDSV